MHAAELLRLAVRRFRLRQRAPLAWLVMSVACGASIASTGCGRPATKQDCDLIVDRYVEIELETLKVTDPTIIAQRKIEMKRDLKDDLTTCPGKRITDSMLACVRTAKTNEELDKCTRW
jgi:hypothetical protein